MIKYVMTSGSKLHRFNILYSVSDLGVQENHRCRTEHHTINIHAGSTCTCNIAISI